MVKIERVLNGAVATITRGGEQVQLFQGQLINYLDLESLKVVGGKVIYSIDETEIVEVIGIPVEAGSPVTEEVAKIVEDTTQVTDAVTQEVTITETVTAEPAPAPVVATKTTTKKK